MTPSPRVRFLVALLTAVVVIAAVAVFSGRQTPSAPGESRLAYDSVSALCSLATRKLDVALGGDVYADIPDLSLVEAKRLVDSAAAVAARHGLQSRRVDSLDCEIEPRLRVLRASVEARLRVVSGIRAAETPLLRALSAIDSVLPPAADG